ncbi:hypothetical protein P4H66_22690 [Paenibacillus dokdonensis]|uniref:Membrane fusion protein biotin-lipoyl like domain-containing protein n=1 Tax=Paenibacillus dokdonensis TaxID=2567944 RepID=A0ABU6GTD5_9BACL|nr:hypothetical protein [Paenibacillus dokdonensis]MEC0242624.1 hypothetical protein [Paenibacillus dokdonensis]
MQEEISKSRKRKVGIIAGLFIGLLLMLTFAGNTFQALTLPKVMTSQITKGSLVHSYEGSSTVNPQEERELTNPAGWKVSKVLVKKGEAVNKGQSLIKYDGIEIKQQLADEQSALKKSDLSLEQLKYSVMLAMQGEDDAAKISASAALETAKVDMTTQQQHIQNLKNTLAANQQIVAPFNGIVTDISAIEGFSSSGVPDIKISNAEKGYKLELLIPSEIASMLSVGEVLDNMKLDREDHPSLTGKIEKMDETLNSPNNSSNSSDANAPGGAMYHLVIALEDHELHGGERVEVRIMKSKGEDLMLVPNKAVHKDNQGVYVYTISESASPLGNAYYAVRTPIKISDANDVSTAVTEGLFDQQEIIVENSGLIMDGTRVHK